jgi:hypothetical protein
MAAALTACMNNIDNQLLITVIGGAKQYSPAIEAQIQAAKKYIADSMGDWDKVRVKNNVVQIHEPDDLGGARGTWVPLSQADGGAALQS